MGWTEWIDLGGEIQGAPAAWTFAGTTYLVARGMDDRLWQRTSTDGRSFSGWEPHANGWTSAAPVLAVLPHGHDVPMLHVVVRGRDGAVWLKRLQDGVWQAFDRLEAGIVGEPAAGTGSATDRLADGTSIARPSLEVVVQGDDGCMYHHSMPSPNPQQLFWQVGGGRLGSPPTVCNDESGRVYAIWRGLDGHGEDGRVWLRILREGHGWSAPEPLAEDSVVGAVRARCFGAHLEVVARSEDDTLLHWHGADLEEHADSMFLTATPTLDSRGGEHRHVFVRGAGGQVLQRILEAHDGYQPARQPRTDRFR